MLGCRGLTPFSFFSPFSDPFFPEPVSNKTARAMMTSSPKNPIVVPFFTSLLSIESRSNCALKTFRLLYTIAHKAYSEGNKKSGGMIFFIKMDSSDEWVHSSRVTQSLSEPRISKILKRKFEKTSKVCEVLRFVNANDKRRLLLCSLQKVFGEWDGVSLFPFALFSGKSKEQHFDKVIGRRV